MTAPRTAPDGRAIRLIHLSLPLGVLLFLGVALFMRPTTTAAPGSLVAPLLAGLAAPLLVVALVLRSRIEPRSSAESDAAWWARNYSQAIVVWSLIEAASLAGLVGYWLTGAAYPLAATAAGLLLFALTAPSRLAGR